MNLQGGGGGRRHKSAEQRAESRGSAAEGTCEHSILSVRAHTEDGRGYASRAEGWRVQMAEGVKAVKAIKPCQALSSPDKPCQALSSPVKPCQSYQGCQQRRAVEQS